RVHHRVLQARVALRPPQAVGISLEVGKIQRVSRFQILVFELVLAIQQLRQPGARINAEMAVALRADVPVILEFLLPDDLPAAVTLHPQPFRANFLFARGVQFTGLPLEPRHCSSLTRNCNWNPTHFPPEITNYKLLTHEFSTRFPFAPSRPSRRRVLPGAFL